MALTEAYLTSAKNLAAFLAAIRNARAPARFTLKFLEDLGFKSTNDRLFIGLLKALRFIDDNGVPTKRYFSFLDDTRWKQVLAEGIHDAYEDLFRLNKKAHALPRGDLQGKLKSLTEGKKSDSVLKKYVMTFSELVKLADFTTPLSSDADAKETTAPPAEAEGESESSIADSKTRDRNNERLIDSLCFRVEVVLPAVRDQAVYDAIFRSLKEHLL